MARCIECNEVFSDSYLTDGVCVDCTKKVSNQLNSDEIDEKSRLLKLFDVKISTEKYLKIKKEIEKVTNKYKLDITIEIYTQITKIISLHLNTLVLKKINMTSNENVNLDKWNKELEYFIQTTILNKLNISEDYFSVIKDIAENEIKNRYWIVTYLGIDNIDLDIALKVSNVSISTGNIQKQINILEDKYNDKISMELYSQIAKLITIFRLFLIKKRLELEKTDSYGNTSLDKWNDLVNDFANNIIVPNLITSTDEINNKVINNIIIHEIENRYWIVTYLGIDNIDLDIALKVSNVSISTGNIQKQINILEDKYNDKISIELYTQISKLITIFRLFLLKKRLELEKTDSYGNTSLDKWNDLVNDFANNIIVPNLIISSNEINNKVINNIIIHEIENNSFPTISKETGSVIGSLIVGVGLLLVILIIYGAINLFSTVSSSTQKGISDSEYYQMKVKQEEQQRKKDVQKMIDEVKYQEYKSKH